MRAEAIFDNELQAQQAIKQPGPQLSSRPLSFSEYKRCKHCWDNAVIEIT